MASVLDLPVRSVNFEEIFRERQKAAGIEFARRLEERREKEKRDRARAARLKNLERIDAAKRTAVARAQILRLNQDPAFRERQRAAASAWMRQRHAERRRRAQAA